MVLTLLKKVFQLVMKIERSYQERQQKICFQTDLVQPGINEYIIIQLTWKRLFTNIRLSNKCCESSSKN